MWTIVTDSAVNAMTYASDGVSRSPIHLLHRASQCAELIFHNAIADQVTARQLAVLLVIAECWDSSRFRMASDSMHR
jgi:hypothetical protein